ncbi:TonB family protein [Paenalcaligenes sp. Me52]|uniref:TonB family protein n=1 Tax=Paenalcaligenes sp. Me52 TaxID=3392038 RepID=UPI003D2E4F13
MDRLPTPTAAQPYRDFLWWAVLASVLIHVGLLWWWQRTPASTPPMPSELDVTLVNFSTESAPLQAKLLAQWQADGGGSSELDVSASAPAESQAMPTPDQLVLQAFKRRQQQLEQEQLQLLSALEAEWEVAQARYAQDYTGDGVRFDTADQDPQLQALAQQLQRLRDEVELYNRKPRYQYDAPSARQSAQAEYLEDWRHKIETLGAEHYPDEARGRLSGSVQLTVFIRKDGSVERIAINKPDPNPLFTLAAQRIVRLAAPFPPFPPELSDETDGLAITRTWHFSQHQLTTQP